jgi:uncharacterized protein
VDELAPDGFAPVALAAFFHQPQIVKILVEAGADVNLRSKNAQNVAAIHAAVARADVQTLELLLLRGADPNLPQEKGFRPLHGAASVGSLASVALLLMFGADLTLAADDGDRPADIARKKGHAFADRLEQKVSL